ncbi:MAG TPA: ATP-binding protein [Anaerolineaceae bacterium]|nr:ATP-binding protein [Anaerolineaceae bacterium]HPN53842.1 ATP-binding protein [Anaerolineaceae bacterium]
MKAPFIGRQRELSLFDRLWQSDRSQFLILYGRRRVGKTVLMTHWIQKTGARALYWVASPDSALAQLRSFSQAVYNFGSSTPAPQSFTYASWEQAWQEVARLASLGRMALFIDEFTYLLEVTPALASHLQHFWDQVFQHSDLFLCLSGSHMGMMMREVLSYQAPLYGRATSQLHLKPLSFGLTQAAFPNYSAVDRVGLYAVFGGIPAYWDRIEEEKSISQNIKDQLLTANNLMQSEPRLLLQDFISEIHNYWAVLTAIANNARTPKDISTYTGLPNGHVPKYLSVLTEAGFVERRVSITAAPGSRAGRHHITDPYLRFYFRFLASRERQLAMGVQDQALSEITRHMIDFIGTHTWEELCREWTLRAGVESDLPFLPDDVGSAWTTEAQVDVAGINSMEKTLILGECKWTFAPVDRDVLAALVESKVERIVPSQGHWRLYLLGFSRSGWTAEAGQYQRWVQQQKPAGKNWQVTGMRLLDLRQVDMDLARWSDEPGGDAEEIRI